MSRPGFADRNKLAGWADTRQSQAELPRLVRRLILESVPNVVQVGMPAGEGVAAGKWDGTVRSAGGNAWVPDGLSVWELSVNGSPGVKANDDYGKRSDTPDGSPVDECTYVEAILRPWTARADWATDRRAEGKWKDVRAYGLDDIEAWLESAPITWAWFSEELGLSPYGMRTAETWWDAWASQTSPSIPPDLVLAGRDAAVAATSSRLNGPGITTIGGASLDETCAFLAAMAVKADTDGNGRMLARLAFVDDLLTWRSLIDSPRPLILVPMEAEFAREVPSGSAHCVLVPVTGTGLADITLPALDATRATAALKAAGMDDDKKADRAGRLARRSLTALRRNLATNKALHRPAWAELPIPRDVRAALLAGSWHDQQDGDQSILAELAGEDYDSFREKAVRLASEADPFILKVGPARHLVSAFDAWLLLAEQLTDDDLKRFESAVATVLGEDDPALELPASDRWKAGLEGKVRAFSSELRQGLARSLALLGVHGGVLTMSGGISGSDWANYLVRSLLKAANEDPSGVRWSSLSGVLPLLGEAAPGALLDAVAAGSAGSDPVMARLFTDQNDDGLFSADSPHTGLLWALEGIAWSSKHFGAAVDALARLEELDPGGRLSNRPIASLVSIFCPWHPENSVSPERRLKVIDAVRKRHETVAWKLLLSMLPEFRGVHSPTREPDYWDWKPAQVPVTTVEWLGLVSAVVDRCMSAAGHDGERWSAFLAHYADLPANDRLRAVEALTEVVEAHDVAQPDRTVLWNALRDLVGQHRQFADADWALPTEELIPLDDLIGKLTPSAAYPRHEWLFQQHRPHFDGARLRDDYPAYDAALAERRRDTMREIEAEGGLDAVRRLAASAEVSWSVGIALAEACPTYDDELLPLLESDSASDLQLAGQYYSQRFRDEGWDWLDALVARQDGEASIRRARLLLAAREFPAAWERAEGQGGSVDDDYWRNFVPYGLGGDFQHVEHVADKLIRVGRNAAAMDLLGVYSRRDGVDEVTRADLVATGLEALLVSGEDAEVRRLSSSDFEEMFALLERNRDAVGVDRVARLEWGFLAALGYEPDVPALQEALAESPDFFVEIVCEVYRPRNRAADEEDVEPADGGARARNGYRLLSSWTRPPGLVDGHLDADRLRTWVDAAKTLLEEHDRLEVGLVHLGHVLVSAPVEADGTWPSEVVRDLFEELHSEQLESGFDTEVRNSRGVTSRGLEDGGAQEEALASKYRTDADRFADEWPRIAAILRNIALSYDADARRNDDSAERFRQGLR